MLIYIYEFLLSLGYSFHSELRTWKLAILAAADPIAKFAVALAGTSAEFAQTIGKIHSESGESEENCEYL